MKRRHEKGAVELFDEATALLKRTPLATIAVFYMGTIPFILGLLFFWADMSRSPAAYDHAGAAALGMAVLYVWMCAWQSAFAHRLLGQLTGGAIPRFPQLIRLQATIQPTKFAVLPIAVLLLLPLAPVYVFYQAAMALPLSAAKRHSSLWPRQSWAILGILFLLTVTVYLNVFAGLLILPQLVKSLFGIDTALTHGAVNPVNSTFLAVTCAVTYLIVCPISKTVYTLRCFYGESIATGEDLTSVVKTFAASAALVMILLLLPGPVHAQTLSARPAAAPQIDNLNRAIDLTLERPEFAWRLPRTHKPASDDQSFFGSMLRSFAQFGRMVDRWVDGLLRWLRDRVRTNNSQPQQGLPAMRAWYYVVLAAAALITAALLIRAFRKKRPAMKTAEPAVAAVFDISRDDIHAGEQPPDEWLGMAKDWIARGDLRMAVRAMFLATLSYLGGQALLSIERGKSNRDYARELRRRARGKPEIAVAFSGTVGLFERSWYGMYDVTPELIGELETNLAHMRACVGQ